MRGTVAGDVFLVSRAVVLYVALSHSLYGVHVTPKSVASGVSALPAVHHRAVKVLFCGVNIAQSLGELRGLRNTSKVSHAVSVVLVVWFS